MPVSETASLSSIHGMRTKSKLVVQRPPADFDEVKRRFIRQNRELAKNNSNQSLRIRSLEIEVSRLLGDNLELREQVLQLHNELYSSRSRGAPGDAVRQIRDDLQAKITELSGLVDGIEALAQASDDAARRATRLKKPLEGQWRERQPLSELMRDSQMPTISEGKHYPRRTMNMDEIQAVRLSDQSSNDSPDLGPPPIAHFNIEDPVKQVSPTASRTSPHVLQDDELPAALSINLETRRKRKDGQPRLEIRQHSILAQSPRKADGEPSTMLRTGAKRKLADRDLDKPVKPAAKDDFSFIRKTTATEGRKVAPALSGPLRTTAVDEIVVASRQDAVASSKPVRKILGDKSANTSPRKTIVASDKGSKATLEKPATVQTIATTNRKRRTSAIPQPLPPEDVLSSIEAMPSPPPAVVELPPKTPLLPDLFSPTPSEPSAARPADEGRAGTPPPGDLSSLSTTTDGGIRPSRRARAAVNYAEPSLIAKMRRPTKQMVDALSGLQDPRRIMSASTKRPSSSQSVVVTAEPVDEDEAWKDLPAAPEEPPTAASPLHNKSADTSSDPLISTQDNEPELPPSTKPSAASATISALMVGSRKRRESSVNEELGTDLVTAVKKMENLDIYDFNESSSPPAAADKADVAAPARAKGHRRHSSIPKNTSVADCLASQAVASSETVLLVGAGRSERAANRRRSMML
jgi:hypothetical protein